MKKMLALLTALVLIVSLLPLSAAAADNDPAPANPGKYPTKEKLYFENVALEVNNNMHLVGSGPDNIMPYLKVDNNGHLIFNNN